jgi:hypothetical protein
MSAASATALDGVVATVTRQDRHRDPHRPEVAAFDPEVRHRHDAIVHVGHLPSVGDPLVVSDISPGEVDD